MRKEIRRGFLGILTVLGLAQRGFFIPYRYADQVTPPSARAPYDSAEALLAEASFVFHDVLECIQGMEQDLQAIAAEAGGAEGRGARFTQDWFPRLDAAAAYCLTRRYRPKRVLEVGAGHSTRFYARAIADGSLETRLIAIDPSPRARLPAVPSGQRDIEHHQATLQEVGLGPFGDLRAGDFLSIDSSHILMPGSDVDHLLGRVLPSLPEGIYLQIHDIFLPDDYPADWAWRGYNEQLAVLQILLSGGWQPVFSSHYVVSRMSDDLLGHCVSNLPLVAGARESSLWLRRVTPGSRQSDAKIDKT